MSVENLKADFKNKNKSINETLDFLNKRIKKAKDIEEIEEILKEISNEMKELDRLEERRRYAEKFARKYLTGLI